MIKIDFHTIYKPAIASPFASDRTYITIPASPLMQPFIRCFWGSMGQFNPHTSPIYQEMLLVPDTCFDLIMIKNNAYGNFKIILTGLGDTPCMDSWSERDSDISIFAVRFHFWTMNIVSRFPMTNTRNQLIAPSDVFSDVEDLCERIFEEPHFKNRMAMTEQYLNERVNLRDTSVPFFNGVDFLINQKGTATLGQLSDHIGYSKRQTERIFFSATGATPKRLSDLIRYQCLWQDMLSARKIDYMMAAFKYNYFDQSHLISDFKKYHSLTPKEALQKAVSQHHNVAYFL